MTLIDRVEIHEFGFEAHNLARDGFAQNITFRRGSSIVVTKYAVVIQTKDGCRGEYVTHWVATRSTLGQMQMLAPRLIGKDARERIAIYEDLKRDIRQFDHMGHGAIDIALWDWAGKRQNASVCEMLGGYRKRLPAYASTYMGDRHGGLSSKEHYADFARHCFDLGYRAFKIHGWNDGNAREEAENVLHVAAAVVHTVAARTAHLGRRKQRAALFREHAPSPTHCTSGAPVTRLATSGTRIRFATAAFRRSHTGGCARS